MGLSGWCLRRTPIPLSGAQMMCPRATGHDRGKLPRPLQMDSPQSRCRLPEGTANMKGSVRRSGMR